MFCFSHLPKGPQSHTSPNSSVCPHPPPTHPPCPASQTTPSSCPAPAPPSCHRLHPRWQDVHLVTPPLPSSPWPLTVSRCCHPCSSPSHSCHLSPSCPPVWDTPVFPYNRPCSHWLCLTRHLVSRQELDQDQVPVSLVPLFHCVTLSQRSVQSLICDRFKLPIWMNHKSISNNLQQLINQKLFCQILTKLRKKIFTKIKNGNSKVDSCWLLLILWTVHHQGHQHISQISKSISTFLLSLKT